MSFDVKYDDRLQKIREAGAAAIRQLDKLLSTRPTPGETLDAEVARIMQEKLHPYGCDLVVHRMHDDITRFLIKVQMATK
jgi:GTP cyclohydrolase I